MKFDISVQGKFYKTVEAPNTGSVLALVAGDIAAGRVPDLDTDEPHDISITPVVEIDEE